MRLSLLLVSLLALAATIAPAIYSGSRNFRWGSDTETIRMSEQLVTLPAQIGDWVQVDEYGLDRTSRDMLKPFASLTRAYRNGDQFATVFLLLGPMGPTAEHTPDICFNSRDYDAQGKRKVIVLNPANANASGSSSGGGKSQLWQLDFKNKGLAGGVLRSWYAWTIDGTWRASADPKVQFIDSRHLFKLQVAIPYASSEAMTADKSGLELIRGIHQYLRQSVFAPAARKP